LKAASAKISSRSAGRDFRAMEPLGKRLGRELDFKISKTGRMANSSLCENGRLGEPRRNNGIHPSVSSLEVRGRGRPRHNVVRASSPVRLPKTVWELAELHPAVSTLGYLPHQATRPERAQEGNTPGHRVHRNKVMPLPIPNLPLFNLPPFQGGSVLLGVFPGLKPWAESCCPFGTGVPQECHHRVPRRRGTGALQTKPASI
jgi:hypothetical protein